ncbi:NUDIX hydrolase [Pseudalkalibacillus berkeleyi]
MNEGKVLMVLQGKPNEPKRWTIPSGGKHDGESDEACCLRELFEETGYKGDIKRRLHVKHGESYGIQVIVHYYEVDIVGGRPTIQDPDELIHEIRWITSSELHKLDLSFPEDLAFLVEELEKCDSNFVTLE